MLFLQACDVFLSGVEGVGERRMGNKCQDPEDVEDILL